jgi:hypothetical protein
MNNLNPIQFPVNPDRVRTSTRHRGRCALYRHFGGIGELLYVGIATNPCERLGAHKRSEWYEEICDITVHFFPSRDEALRAEQHAINTENPIHNSPTRGRASERHEIGLTKTKQLARIAKGGITLEEIRLIERDKKRNQRMKIRANAESPLRKVEWFR